MKNEQNKAAQPVLTLECPAVPDGGWFPVEHTGRGADVSPELRLGNLAPGTAALAVILEDLDHPVKGFPHWVAWNFPPAECIPGGVPKGKRTVGGAVQGIAYGFHRYAGPKPPKWITHRYRFTVYALDTVLELGAAASKWRLLRAMQGHVLQQASLTASFGSYKRGKTRC